MLWWLQLAVNLWAAWQFAKWANHWRKLLTEDRDGNSGRSLRHWTECPWGGPKIKDWFGK